MLIKPSTEINGIINAPPSKSYTHRAIIIASLAKGESSLKYPLNSEDTLSSVNACESLGSQITCYDDYWLIKGVNNTPQTPNNILDVKNSGTTLRLITSIAALASNYTIITGDDSLRNRPMQPLIDALKPLGVSVKSSQANGKAPLIIKNGFKGGTTSIEGNISSQFISSILISSVLADKPTQIKIKNKLVSKPYIEITLDVIKSFGAEIDYDLQNKIFYINPGLYKSSDYVIEGDYSSASYLLGAVAVSGGKLTINNLFKDSIQGDKKILDILSEMGATIKQKTDSVTIESNSSIHGIDIDLSDCPDLLPTVAVLGSVAEGTTKISGVEHARFKETDRIKLCTEELTKLNVDITENNDGMIINGGVGSGTVSSHGDHRIAMALSLIGLKHGLKIIDSDIYSVSFPEFPNIMNNIGCNFINE